MLGWSWSLCQQMVSWGLHIHPLCLLEDISSANTLFAICQVISKEQGRSWMLWKSLILGFRGSDQAPDNNVGTIIWERGINLDIGCGREHWFDVAMHSPLVSHTARYNVCLFPCSNAKPCNNRSWRRVWSCDDVLLFWLICVAILPSQDSIALVLQGQCHFSGSRGFQSIGTQQ